MSQIKLFCYFITEEQDQEWWPIAVQTAMKEEG